VQSATSVEELLDACAFLPEPGCETAAHERQHVHQRKRQRAASQALCRLARLLCGREQGAARAAAAADPRLARAARAAAQPSCAAADEAEDCEGAASALAALAVLHPLPAAPQAAAGLLASRCADGCAAGLLSLPAAAAASWALRRLRLPPRPELEAACAHLPWRVEPRALTGEADSALDLDALRTELPWKADTLLTRLGAAVRERRETCWLAEPGIGGLSYSGKLMPPAPLPARVAAARDGLAAAFGERYDCALCNWYEGDSGAACAWHADPEHGSLWALETAVVSVGETRRFAFRATGDAVGDQYTFYLFHGDVVRMWADCQQRFQHAVMGGEGAHAAGDRASLVFKQALPRGPAGRRGHGGVAVLAPERARPALGGERVEGPPKPASREPRGPRVKKPPPPPLW